MNWKRTLKYIAIGIASLVGLLVVVALMAQTGCFPVFAGEFDHRTLTVTDCEGGEKGQLTLGVVDSFSESYVGLSRHDSLEPDHGLLFAYDKQASHRIEMRNMDFALDVIFVHDDARIGTIETLPAPESLLEFYLTYNSTFAPSKYIIETHAGWSDERGISAGDCVEGLPE